MSHNLYTIIYESLIIWLPVMDMARMEKELLHPKNQVPSSTGKISDIDVALISDFYNIFKYLTLHVIWLEKGFRKK